MSTAARSSAPRRMPASVPGASTWKRYLGRHGKSFAFASAFMPPADRARVEAVYSWCRYTDDIVDLDSRDDASFRLEAWLELSRDAYDGVRTGVELVDEVMTMSRAAGVPFTCIAELIEGMRMDLRHTAYPDEAALRVYTWRAAGTVGVWLATVHGVRDPWAIERAALLGQAMQLTNIVRDVGEDLARDRLYVPRDLLAAHGFTVEELRAARARAQPLGERWAALTEELMAIAARDYVLGREALFHLPPGFRRAAAVASFVYEGIHEAVRRGGYRNLHTRAATSAPEKLLLAARALGAS